MRSLHPEQTVRLTQDVARCELHRGDRGVVLSRWFAPCEAYEVEFTVASERFPVRVVLLAEQVAAEGLPERAAPNPVRP